jgi:transporter family protein
MSVQQVSILIAYLALTLRIVLLGFERIFLKLLGTDQTEDQSLSITTVFFAFGTLGLFPFTIPTLKFSLQLIFPLISSIFYSFAFWMYTASLQTGEVSLVTPLYNFNLVFLLVFSTLFLQEPLTILKVAGVILIFIGMSFLQKGTTFQDSLKNVFKDKAAQLMVGASLLMSIGRIIDGYALDLSDVFEPLVYSFFVYLLITIVLLGIIAVKKELRKPVTIIRDQPALSVVAGVTNAGGYLFLLVAFTVLDVSIAEPIGALNVFVAMFLARYFFQEDIKQRLIAAGLIILGVFFLFLPTLTIPN